MKFPVAVLAIQVMHADEENRVPRVYDREIGKSRDLTQGEITKARRFLKRAPKHEEYKARERARMNAAYEQEMREARAEADAKRLASAKQAFSKMHKEVTA